MLFLRCSILSIFVFGLVYRRMRTMSNVKVNKVITKKHLTVPIGRSKKMVVWNSVPSQDFLRDFGVGLFQAMW